MKVKEAAEIIKLIKELKYKLVKGQDFPNASLMRDMEKRYEDKQLEIES
jgi:hypothetical protein